MTVALVMVVKNEAPVIERCLETVRPVISSWTIVDTGSDDGTPEIVEQMLDGIPGTLHRREWVSFGHNKTEALELARFSADHLLIVDADMTLVGAMPHRLSPAHAFMAIVRDGSEFEYRLPVLVSGSVAWRFEGVTHEFLTCDEEAFRDNIDDFFVIHHCDGSRRPEKLYSDLNLLIAAFATDPFDARTVFYLAQTHRDLGNIEQAISFYRLRCEMNGWDEERYYARYQLGCLLAAHISFEQGADELLRAWKERPARIESLRALANSANNVADQAAFPNDVLFVHRDLYAR